MNRAKLAYNSPKLRTNYSKSSKAVEPDEQKRKILIQKQKPILLKQLQNELKHLDELDEVDFSDDLDPYMNDRTLDHLQMISKQASKLQIKEIEKLCRLAIGKRILNIQLKKKKIERNSKLLKKEQIELFFRQNRIKRFDYDSLVQEKLSQSTLIVKAYDNGKGFIQSDRIYKEKYEEALQQCNFMQTIKQVNKVFYANYSGIYSGNASFAQGLLNFVWIPMTIFLCLGITLPFASFQHEQIILMCLLSLILIILFYLSVRSYQKKPNKNNQIEQSVCDVRAYFQEINSQSDLKGTNVQWKCSSDFMYLQVIFHNGFPH